MFKQLEERLKGKPNSPKEVVAEDIQNTIRRMIENSPRLYGLGGSRRSWLVRLANKYGIDEDWLPSDEGTYNQPNE